MTAPTRDQWIADARALLDLLESNPDLPLHTYSGLEISYHPYPSDEDDAHRKAAVDAIAELLGVPVMSPGSGRHYEATVSVGSATYRAVAVLKDYRERHAAIQSLGEAALREREATS